ncbi:hypothetical protein B0O99DRAFT_636301 [Bisporella sp. PMI_857]|nr:hypothetical protein B0O99DRAFT_636301 [Bisporella sp. PMI_857]
MTDMIITSFTKSFNRYADVIAGSVVTHLASPKYGELKYIFDKYLIREWYVVDAEAMERHGRDYLLRVAKLNENASSLIHNLLSYADDLKYATCIVFYPSINASGGHYKQFMRPVTVDFTPGYGISSASNSKISRNNCFL